MKPVLPVDPGIPALAAFSARGLAAVLAPLGVPVPVSGAEVLKHHPGSRCTLRVRGGGRWFAVKAFHRKPAREAEAMTRLRAAGLASGRPPTIAPLLGFDPDLRILVLEWLDGPSAFELIVAGEGARAGELAAEWLRVASRFSAAVDREYGFEAALERAGKWLLDISAADSDLGAEAAGRIGALVQTPPPASRPALQHGSLSVHHVLDLGEGPGVLDLDELARGPIERDAGRFLATISRAIDERPELARESERAVDAFRAGLAGLVDERALAWYRSAALVKHAASLCRHRPDRWRDRAHLLLTA